MMDLSTKGFQAIKSICSFRARPYTDDDGDLAIGYGHKISIGDGVAKGDLINPFKADELLRLDLQQTIDHVNNSVTSNISQQSFDSLVLYSYFNRVVETE